MVIRALLFLCLSLTSGGALAQSSKVDPADLTLTLSFEERNSDPYMQEMVLVTLHGVYRRHITREVLNTPELPGFNWMQLGEDYWWDSMLDGKKVKNMRRRMAFFPERTGTMTIPPFTHTLTLLDERNAWFEYDIQSAPLTLNVKPAPPADWWFPVRRLEVSDRWSNPPDQLQPGEGVLRIVMLEATGVSPEMLPPMPELTSPSARIFAHPEKRLLDLSPNGPVSRVFWRWTIKPEGLAAGRPAAILDPISFDYFDTNTREAHTVTISAQRVALDAAALPPPVAPGADPVRLRPLPVLIGFALVLGLALAVLGASMRGADFNALLRRWRLDPAHRAIRRAALQKDAPGFRRAALALIRQEGGASDVPDQLDRAVFAPVPTEPDLNRLRQALFSDLRNPS